jgi:hypothetical protein
MTKARAIALKTLKEDNDEGYWQFLMDYIQMSLDFYAQEEFEIEMLLELWKEAVEVKTKMDKNGKLFDSFTDNKTLKHTSMKYEILKRSKRTAETYQAGIDSIKTTYDDARKKNDPNASALLNVHEIYSLAIHEIQFGDVVKAHDLWNEAVKAKNDLKPIISLEEQNAMEGFSRGY